MRFLDIPQYTRAKYEVDVGWAHLEYEVEQYKIDFSPDYQREHVWNTQQQIAFVEFCLRGGESGKSIYFNYATKDNPHNERIEIVDGKQRLTAARRFMANDLPAFGYTLNQFEDRLSPMEVRFRFHINDLETRADVISWYLDLNYRGTPHTEEELQRVQRLLTEENGE